MNEFKSLIPEGCIIVHHINRFGRIHTSHCPVVPVTWFGSLARLAKCICDLTPEPELKPTLLLEDGGSADASQKQQDWFRLVLEKSKLAQYESDLVIL